MSDFEQVLEDGFVESLARFFYYSQTAGAPGAFENSIYRDRWLRLARRGLETAISEVADE